MTDKELNEDRGVSINHSEVFGEDDSEDEIDADLHTIAIQLEQLEGLEDYL